MSKAEVAKLSPRDQKDLAEIRTILAKVKRIVKEMEDDRKKNGPIVKPRKVSIVDEVKAILGKS